MQLYESFTDHWEICLSALAKLNYWMASYMMNQEVFVMKTCYSSADSCVPLTEIWSNSLALVCVTAEAICFVSDT